MRNQARSDDGGQGGMRSPFGADSEFQKLLDGHDNASVIRIAFEIASDASPDLDVDGHLDRIKSLADRIRERSEIGGNPRKILGQINWVLYVEEKYEGDRESYFDPRNSYLNEVMARKRGIPITLSILYQEIARQLGVELYGLNLPAHFMLGLKHDPEPLIIDPFHAGEILNRQGCERRLGELFQRPISLTGDQLAACSRRAVVTRMLSNLKSIHQVSHDYPSAYHVQRRLVFLTNAPEEHRDFGLTCLRLEKPGEAIEPLQSYLNAAGLAEDRQAMETLLRDAYRQVAQWN